MSYLIIFVGATLLALCLFMWLPEPAGSVKARLGALEAVGPGLIAVDGPRARNILSRRHNKHQQKRRQILFRRIAPLSVLGLLLLGGIVFACDRLGAPRALASWLFVGIVLLGLRALLVSWRRRAIARRLPDLVRELARDVRQSPSLTGAVQAIAERSRGTTGRELRRLHASIAEGATDELAFGRFAERNASLPADLLRQAFSFPGKRGPALALALDQVAMILKAQAARRYEARVHRVAVRVLSWGLAGSAGWLVLGLVKRAQDDPPKGVWLLGAYALGILVITRLVTLTGKDA